MIEVIQTGLWSTVQDRGRTVGLPRGIPQSGAMDMLSAQMANLLLQNEEDDAVIECTILGPKLMFHCETSIVLTGGQGQFTINDESISNYRLLDIRQGDVLTIGPITHGVRTYIGIKGGIKTSIVLGSRSYFRDVNEGGILKKGMNIPVENHSVRLNETIHFSIKNPLVIPTKLMVSKGPEFDLVNNQINTILDRDLVIGDNDRMAYIIDSGLKNTLGSLLTTSVFPGVVQLTPSGQLLMLMRDCQVTGGYPRILLLHDESINTLAQLKKGQSCSLHLID